MVVESIDLIPQLGTLPIAGEELQYFKLQDTSPPRPKMRLWSKETGESWDFYNFRVPALLATGRWTRNESEVPEIVRSSYPCFLAPESEIRAELDALGIVVRCNSKHPSRFAMEQVAAKKHPNSWKAWQAHIAEQDRKRWEAQQTAQTNAMIQLAQSSVGGQVAVAPVVETKQCEKCGEMIEITDGFAMARHVRSDCKGGA